MTLNLTAPCHCGGTLRSVPDEPDRPNLVAVLECVECLCRLSIVNDRRTAARLN